MVVKTPVDSTTYWAPASPHLMLTGSLLQRDTRERQEKSRFLHGCFFKSLRVCCVHSLVEDTDLMTIDDQLASLCLDLTLVGTVGGVVLEHVDLGRGSILMSNTGTTSGAQIKPFHLQFKEI